MICRIFLIVFFGLLVSHSAQAADPFTIYGVHVDASADNAIEAQTKAIEDGQLRAANMMVERVSLEKDRVSKGFQGVSAVDGPKLIRGLAIDNEKRSANRYLGDINVSFNPRAIEAYLRAKGLQMITTQARKRLVIPILNGAPVLSENQWYDVWRKTNLASSLTPMEAIAPVPEAYAVLASGAGKRLDVAALQSLGRIYGVQQILVVNARDSGGNMSASVTDIALDTKESNRLGTFYAATPRELLDKIVKTLESNWKQSVVSQSSTKNVILPVSVLYRNHAEWINLQNLINDTAQIRSASLQAISKTGAMMNLVYGGDFDRMKNELAYKGVEIRQDENLGTVLFKSGAFR
ncbi:MAG TPA: DUF2066 domain-containing protein [Hellea balneolensis]|uniref:DUF2066 domain-containing protein n=1 Tax=Hellea balneolensis TaxID=287478 RepID=A0A7C5LV40_9PROT|nr:DUF2066 domain-containing protein [Hellea balneolensis]